MSRIFVIGTGPMMDGGERFVTAHPSRTWHFVTALRRAGHEALLCTVSQKLSDQDPRVRLVEPREKDGFAYENLDMRMGNMLAYLAERCAAFRPDAVVGVNTEPAAWACRMRPTVPVWADLNGWVMSEAQLKAAQDGSDDILAYFWRHERAVLRRADKMSAVSNAQRFAVLGELATIGRLNRHNVGYDLVVTIPNSADPATAGRARDREIVTRLVGQQEAFVVLQIGGFNTWSDPDTLFESLERAMAQNPAVHFIATGGRIAGHADAVYDKFHRRVEQSPHRARYHLLDWVPADQFASYLAASHVAICVDFPSVETEVGSRTRLLDAMAHGLPVLTTRGTELSLELERAGVGWVVPQGDAKVVAEKIVAAAADRDATAAVGRRIHEFVMQRFSIARNLEPLARWAEKPCFAPDNEIKRAQSPTIVEAALNALEANARDLDDVENVQSLIEARRDLERLRSRWPIRLWRRLRGRRSE